jgi:S1-C subfamily serine protease
LAPLLLSALLCSRARAQEKEEVKKLIEDVRTSVLAEVKKVLQAEGDKFLNEVSKILERRAGERIAKLEEELKAREKKISELEAKVKELAGGKPAPQAQPGAAPAAFLGVSHIEPSADLRSRLKIDNGAVVTNVIENSPAALLGIQPNDVILSVNGASVTSGNLTSVITALRPDQEINVVFVHDGNKVTKTTKLVEREKFLASSGKAQEEKKKEPIVLGVVAVEKEGGGIIVDAVEDGFTGSVAGLKKDDKLTHLNGKELKALDDIIAELKKTLDGDTLKLVYVRGDETIKVDVMGSHGKDGAKLIARNVEKKEAPKEAKKETAEKSPEKTPEKSPEKNPEKNTEKKPGLLGISVVPDAGGVVIESVLPDTPAATAGVQKGDALKKLNGQDISDVGQLKDLLSKLSAGDKVSLLLGRGGQPVELKDITLGAKGEKAAATPTPGPPKEASKPAATKAAEKPKKPGRLGILARQTDDNKVLVKTVNGKSAAEKAGLMPEDVIIKVNDKAIHNFDDLTAVCQSFFAGDTITVRVKRGDEEKDLKLTLGEPGADEAANP